MDFVRNLYSHRLEDSLGVYWYKFGTGSKLEWCKWLSYVSDASGTSSPRAEAPQQLQLPRLLLYTPYMLRPRILSHLTRPMTSAYYLAKPLSTRRTPSTPPKMTLALDEIPTLTLLYKIKTIETANDLDPAYKASAALNNKISVIKRDITTLAIDAIVNAANNSLLGGGGVDGAIHRAAGPKLYDECETLDGCDTGDSKITDAYELPCKKVIHAVGPIYWKEGKRGSAELLAGCYRKSLQLAVDNGCKSIAFSALSTGVYGYPSGEASEVALETVRKFLEEEQAEKLDRVIFCNFLQKDEDAYFENIP